MNHRRRSALLLLLGGLAAVPVAAQTAPDASPRHDQARIQHGAATGLSGRIAINQVAGVGNAQANLAVIAIAEQGQAVFDLGARQQVAGGDRLRAASARISGQALNDASGVLSLNQAAGSGNAQLNLFAIGHGAAVPGANLIAGLDDAALAAVAGDNRTEGAEASPVIRTASIDADALRGGRGVVQVNQTAGVGNASVNAIVLQLPGGAL